MTQRWYIYRDGRALGPYEAREIRESLREGMWDPFDLVSAEGSSVKIPLVEVDDIFASSQVELAAAPRSMAEPITEDFQEPALEVRLDEIPLASESERGRYGKSSNSAKRSSGRSRKPDQAAGAAARKKSKRDPKRFFLRDAKGRLLGPQSAGEIQSLFYKGVLDKSVKVLREGSTQAVPVAKFVTVYSERRRKKALQGAHPTLVGGMSTSQLHQVALAKNIRSAAQWDFRPLLAVGVFVFGLAIALLAIWLVMGTGSDFSAKEQVPIKVEPKPIRPNNSGKLKRPQAFKVKTTERDQTTVKAAPLKKRPTVERSRSTLRPTGRTSTPKATPVYQAPRYTPPKKKPPIYQKPIAKSYPTKPTYAAKPGPSVNQLGSGQVVSDLGPCRYKVASVKACTGACSVTFAGPGGVFVGKFFGDAYKNALLAKGGSAYISGTVTRNGSQVSIIINGVK